MASVQLKAVGKSYDAKTEVIESIDLDIKHGEFVVLVGPSGCGKSTLLRMIAGLESTTRGDIFIDGQRVNDLPPRHRDLAMVFQDYALYPHKTLFDNMAFGLRLRGKPEHEITSVVMDTAKLLRIDHMLDRKPAALSGGQRQRVAIGRAIVRDPKVFLFDEPLSNLDAQLRGEMRAEIKRLHQRLGATMIYVTHDQVEAMTLADRIAVLKGGHKEQYDTPDRIYNHPASTFVAGFVGAPPMNLLPFTSTDGKALKLGIRPENLHLNADKAQDLVFKCAVVLCEPLGSETLATLCIQSHNGLHPVQQDALQHCEIIVRMPASFRENTGAQVSVHAAQSNLHLFNTPTGLAAV